MRRTTRTTQEVELKPKKRKASSRAYREPKRSRRNQGSAKQRARVIVARGQPSQPKLAVSLRRSTTSKTTAAEKLRTASAAAVGRRGGGVLGSHARVGGRCVISQDDKRVPISECRARSGNAEVLAALPWL